MSTTDQELNSILAHAFDLEIAETVSKEKIIEVLSWRVEKLLAANPDQLFSMLYRLDISEAKIKAAMFNEDVFAKNIAVLIYERQLEKMISRKRFAGEKPEDDLAW
jgi:hypothetical protein